MLQYLPLSLSTLVPPSALYVQASSFPISAHLRIRTYMGQWGVERHLGFSQTHSCCSCCWTSEGNCPKDKSAFWINIWANTVHWYVRSLVLSFVPASICWRDSPPERSDSNLKRIFLFLLSFPFREQHCPNIIPGMSGEKKEKHVHFISVRKITAAAGAISPSDTLIPLSIQSSLL